MDLRPIPPKLERYIEAVRDFDRFYEIRLNRLRQKIWQYEATWCELRVFRFLGARTAPSPSGFSPGSCTWIRARSPASSRSCSRGSC